MGYARPSCWLDIGDTTFNDKFEDVFQEHIEVSCLAGCYTLRNEE